MQMAMDEERGGEGGDGGGEEIFDSEYESSPQGEFDLVQEITNVIESVAQLGDYRRTQRRECNGLVRRMKLLLPFLDELRDLDCSISETAIDSLNKLRRAVLMAKKLLKTCNEGSKIHMAVESEAIMIKFHAVHDKLCHALEGFPYDELEISEEMKEQVELMRVQLQRAKSRTDTQDIELAMDMIVVFSKKNDRNADSAIIERLAKKLELNTIEDLKNETIAVRNFVKKGGQSPESIQHIIDLLNKFKQIAGMEISDDVLDHPVMPKMLEKSNSLVIPHEFICPISLEIMTDPVITATGQTYERDSIQQWFNSNHWTCPKSRQNLAHLSLAPNFALKNLIMQWCEEHNFKLPKKDKPSSSETNCNENNEEILKLNDKEEILKLIENLTSSTLEVQRKAVKKIRLLSKENPEKRILIASNGAVPHLTHLLSYPDSKIQEHAVTALLNLSLDEANKHLIAKQGAIPEIIEILQNGSTEARENSAAALCSLSMLNENNIIIGMSNGIPPLVDLLKNGTVRGKKDAASALFNLSLNLANKGKAIDAGIVPPLLQLVKDGTLGMVDEALSILLLLASHPDGRHEIGQFSFIETLVEFTREGTPKNKECATAVLLELGSSGSSFILAALQFGVYEHLVDISQTGTDRGKRKASALLQLMSKTEQI